MRHLLLVLIATTIPAGCAAIDRLRTPGPEERITLAVTALGRGDYATAYDQLDRLAERDTADPVGRRALLMLAAAELDPRNPVRTPEHAMYRLARLLARPAPTEWTGPVGETLYLLARLAGAPPPVDGDESTGLPQLPDDPLTERLERTAAARDSLRVRVDTLEQTLAQRTQELTEAKREIERLRKLLKP